MGILVGIFGFAFLIFFHELGHFLFAKLFGVRVYTFSIGFGKKLISKKIGNTEYALSAIPLGGYVKLKGESIGSNSNYSKNIELSGDGSAIMHDADSMNAQHPFKRILISFAGPFFNFLLAFVVYMLVFNYGFFKYTNLPIVGGVSENAKSLNILLPGDEIKKIQGDSVGSFKDISINMSKAPIQAMEKLEVSIFRNGQNINLEIPLTVIDGKKFLGIEPKKEYIKYSLFESIQKSLQTTADNTLMIYNGIKKLITGAIGLENLSSAIGMVDASAKAYENSIRLFLVTLCIISINLAIVNLLPLPMLDGGQILFDLYRWTFKREVSVHIAKGLMLAGFIFIAGLMSIGIFNDINRMIS